VDFVSEPLDESMVYLPFLDWLASVTERLNETMHYESPGQPDPVVFHVPHVSVLLLLFSLRLFKKFEEKYGSNFMFAVRSIFTV